MRFSSARHPDTLTRERRPGSSWRVWKPCAASCSMLCVPWSWSWCGEVVCCAPERAEKAGRRAARVSHNDRADWPGRGGRWPSL